MQVSIIIPVYNAQQYLEICLESACMQTIKELEIICIDDGSTDDSFTILERYGEKDKRIKIIKQVNRGPGMARNRGMLEASGEFVTFLDADDYYIDSSFMEQLYYACVENQVKVCGSALMHLRRDTIIDDITLQDVKMVAKRNKILWYQDFQFDYGYTGFLFSKKMLQEENITFPVYRRYQDPCFLVRAMYAAEQFVFLETAAYVARVPTMASRFSKDKAADLLKGLFDNLMFAYEKKLDKLFQKSLARLEYEYYSIICRYISLTDEQQVGLLWKINHLVRKVLHDDGYMIRPLSFIISENKEYYPYYAENLYERIEGEPFAYLYGAGEMARKFIWYLKRQSLLYKIKGIVVSVQTKDKQCIEGIQVGSLEELGVKKKDLILISTGAVFHKEIVESLHGKGFNNNVILDSVFLEELQEAD
ncbi:MAG: glycosyltransferase [Lachnospiraceae bacterium]|nr:glycosyltransferase [Lachnospiraceae bacterium]